MSVALQTCNRERFEELKRRLITTLDRLLGEATDQMTIGRLQREREMAQAMSMPVPCPPEPVGTIPGSSIAPVASPSTTGSVGSPTAPAAAPPQAPPGTSQLPPGRPPGDDPGTMAPLRAALDAAIANCDRDAFQAAKDALLEAIGQLLTRSPGNSRWLAERRRIEETQFPRPCPPRTAYTPGGGLPMVEEDLRWMAELGPFFGRTDIPQAGIGVTRDGPSGDAPETDADLTGDKVDTIGFGGALGFGEFRVRGHYLAGDASTAFDIQPISGGFNGAVFGAPSPAGSSGTGAGSVNLVGTTEVDLSQFGLGLDVGVAQPSPATRIFISVDYFREVRRHDLSLTGTVSTIRFTQERDQRIRDNGFGAGIGAEARLPLRVPEDGGAAISARLIAAAQAYWLDSDLSSVERNVSNFGPASDRDFTIEIDESDSGFGVAAQASAEIDFALSADLSIFVGATAAYRSRVGAIFNPNSGDQVFLEGLTTSLRTEDSWSWRVGAGFRVAFGR